jgi:1-acyl-sn-glycerol-3-phosphate acyltransferase
VGESPSVFVMDFPNDFTVVDWILGIWSVGHAFVAIVIWIPIDAEYKRCATNLLYKMFLHIHRRPFLFISSNAALVALTIYLAQAAYSNNYADVWARVIISGFVLFCALHVQPLVRELVTLGPIRYLEREQSLRHVQIINYQPPPNFPFGYVLGTLEWIVDADFTGIENLDPSNPGLFVANHQNYCFEVPMLVNKIYQSKKGMYIRGLADHFHFGIPMYSSVLRYVGAVDGTRSNVDCLMESRQNVLVYPGGASEVMKHSSVPKYTLLWKERLGFARLAIKHGHPIVPVASIGVEDALITLFDVPLGFYRKGLSFPIPGPLWPHRLQKIYYWIGEPIPTTKYNGEWEKDEYTREVRDAAKAAVEAGIRFLQEKQANDPHRYRFPVLNDVVTFVQNRLFPKAFGAPKLDPKRPHSERERKES